MSETNEAAYERHICEWLVDHGGYQRVKVGNAGDGPRDFDAAAGVDTADLFEFIGATQADEWSRLVSVGYGDDASPAQAGFTQFPRKQFDEWGTMPTGTFSVLGVT